MFETLQGFLRKDKSKKLDLVLQDSRIESPEDVSLDELSQIDIEDLPKGVLSQLELDEGYEYKDAQVLTLGKDRKTYVVFSQNKKTPDLNREIEIIDFSLEIGNLGKIKILMPSDNPNHQLYTENGHILWTKTPGELNGKGLATERLILADTVSQKFWKVPLISSTIMFGKAPERTWEKLRDKGIVDPIPKINESSRQRYSFRKRDPN